MRFVCTLYSVRNVLGKPEIVIRLVLVLVSMQVIDVDYHSGNGSLGIHWEDPSVFFGMLSSM